MNTFTVVGADDDVAEGGAVLEDEDGVFVAALGLLVAGRRLAVPLDHAAVELSASRDSLDGGKVGRLGRRGELSLQVRVGLPGDERGRDERGEDGELHCVCWSECEK